MLMMISANDLIPSISGGSRASRSTWVAASARYAEVDRGGAEVLRPGRAQLRHAALRRIAGLRLRRNHRFRPPGRGLRGRRADVAGPDRRHRLRLGGPGLQDLGRAVPHVDAGRLRGRADAGHRLLRRGAQGRGDRPVRPRPGRPVWRPHRPVAADHHRHLDPVDDPRCLRRHRPVEHQAPDGVFLDRPCRLRDGRPRRRDPRRACAAC